ncbi:MAG: hypothetical protein KF767_05055 [Bdellovibrionaceae bacterium]|nr:hypothetical protein [Pseudobdellovibrionaceae bacterium]
MAFGALFAFNHTHAANSYKVDPAATVTISELGYCREVTNNHASRALFVPTRTSTEFLSFINNKPAYVNLSLCCPTGYVLIPGNGTYGTSNFCMMQFEAKNVSGVATSQASVSPWHSISHYDARRRCQALGTGYDLPSNNHWQTMARNVELVAANWSSGTVGSGCLYIGNAGVSGVCSYNGTGAPNYETGTSGTNRARARLRLSNGQEIWDVSANVAEHIAGVYDANTSFVGGNVVNIDAPHKSVFGPSGTYSAASCAASSTDSTGGLCGLGWYGYGSAPALHPTKPMLEVVT